MRGGVAEPWENFILLLRDECLYGKHYQYAGNVTLMGWPGMVPDPDLPISWYAWLENVTSLVGAFQPSDYIVAFSPQRQACTVVLLGFNFERATGDRQAGTSRVQHRRVSWDERPAPLLGTARSSGSACLARTVMSGRARRAKEPVPALRSTGLQ